MRLELLASLGQVCVSDNIQAAFRKRKWDQCVERLLEAFDGNDLSESEAEEGDCKGPAAVDSGESCLELDLEAALEKVYGPETSPDLSFYEDTAGEIEKKTESEIHMEPPPLQPSQEHSKKQAWFFKRATDLLKLLERAQAQMSPQQYLTDLGTHEKRVKAVIMHLEGVLKGLRLYPWFTNSHMKNVTSETHAALVLAVSQHDLRGLNLSN